MVTHAYIIHHNPAIEPVETTVSSLIAKISNWYRFLGVEEEKLTVKRFRNSALEGSLILNEYGNFEARISFL